METVAREKWPEILRAIMDKWKFTVPDLSRFLETANANVYGWLAGRSTPRGDKMLAILQAYEDCKKQKSVLPELTSEQQLVEPLGNRFQRELIIELQAIRRILAGIAVKIEVADTLESRMRLLENEMNRRKT